MSVNTRPAEWLPFDEHGRRCSRRHNGYRLRRRLSGADAFQKHTVFLAESDVNEERCNRDRPEITHGNMHLKLIYSKRTECRD